MADVVNYSMLMGDDDTGTLAAVKELQDTLIARGIADNNGRLVKTTGDGFLIEFGSALSAVLFSIGLQVDLAASNAKKREGKKLQLRIGINIGDNIVDEEQDVFGDGVNVASRLQNIADVGGICITQSTYDFIKSKLADQFREGAKESLKNIAQPVQVWHWPGLQDSEAGHADRKSVV